MDTRPELLAAPQEFYSGQEAVRYSTCAATKCKQYELTRRSLQLGGFQSFPQRPLLLLDIGCGSGLSGQVCEQSHIHYIGTDISADMLTLAQQQQATLQPRNVAPAAIVGGPTASQAGELRVTATSSTGGGSSSSSSSSSRALPSMCMGLVLSDMGHGLPFRGHDSKPHEMTVEDGLFDGCISISAVQWLVFKQDWRAAAARFFSSLYRLLLPGASAVLQIYVLKECEALRLVQSAAAAGFGTICSTTSTDSSLQQPDTYSRLDAGLCQLVADYPHLNGSKKYSLLLRKPEITRRKPASHTPSLAITTVTSSQIAATTVMCSDSNNGRQQGCSFQAASQAGWAVQAAPECPLAWHVGGTCTLCLDAATQQPALQPHLASAACATNFAAPQQCSTEANECDHSKEDGSDRQGGSNTGCSQHREFMIKQHHAHARDFSLASRSRKPPPATRKRKHSGTKENTDAKLHQAHNDKPHLPSAASIPTCFNTPQESTADEACQQSVSWCPNSEPHYWWQGRTAECYAAAVVSGLQPLRITCLMDAPHLFKCGGHTSVTVMVTGASLTACLTSADSALQQFLAKLVGVSESQVHSVKVEHMPVGSLSGVAEPSTLQPGPSDVMQSVAKAGGKSKSARTPQQQQVDSDRHIGASLSYHALHCTPEQAVGVAALQAPGVHPPYCILDDCSQWHSSVMRDPQAAPAAVTACPGTSCNDSAMPGWLEQQDHTSRIGKMLQQVAEHCVCICTKLASVSCLHVLGDEASGHSSCGVPAVQASVVAVYVELAEHVDAACGAAGASNPATAPVAACNTTLICRLLGAVYDTCSTLHIPSALAAVEAAATTGNMQPGSGPAQGPGAIKQTLMLQALRHVVCKAN